MRSAKQKPARLVGGHLSAAGGIDKAVERAAAIGGNAVQVFSASPRVWKRPELESIDFAAIKKNQAELGVSTLVTHAMYLVNLASDKPEQLEKSRAVIQFDLEFDARAQGRGVVVHLGSHQGRGWEAVREQVATEIAAILSNAPTESHFLIENSAGQNGKIGSDFGEIRWLLDQINDPRLAWCVDTCHAFAAGYALGFDKPQNHDPALVKASNSRDQTISKAISEYDLWSSLAVVHVNDSKDPFGSGRDRHANFGSGTIDQSDLSYFLNQPQLTEGQGRTIPLITEVPGEDGTGPDKINLERLQALVQ